MKNLFFELTIKSLKNNKIKTLATLIGVVISVALITNIIFTSSSLYNFMIDDTKARFGDWSVQIENSKGKVKEETEKSGLDKGLMSGISYAYIDGGVNPDKPFIYIASMDKRMKEITDFQMLQGRLPKTKNEIVIPEHLLTNGGIKHEIGDKIKLNEGYRINIVNGEELTQRNHYDPENEVFIKDRSKIYTVVGISKRLSVEPYMAAGYTALTMDQPNIVHIEDTFFHSSEFEYVDHIISNYYIPVNAVEFNQPLLKAQGKIPGENAAKDMILLSLLLVLFIGICGHLLMYNAFTFSLLEHVKSYRILASVGATAKQLRKASLYEGIFIAIVGIPVGMIMGAVATYLLVHFFGSNIISMFTMYTNGMLTYKVGSEWVIVAFVVANLMVILSILLPAYRTGKIKPVNQAVSEGINNSFRRKLAKNDIFKEGFFSLESKLAFKNFRKNSKTYRYPIVSLTLSIVLFLSAGALGTYMENVLDVIQGPEKSYDIAYMSQSSSEAEKAFVHLSTVEGVEECSHMKYSYVNMTLGDKHREATLYIMDDNSFKKYLDINGIENESYFDQDNPKALALAYITKYDSWKQTFTKEWISERDKIAGWQADIKGVEETLYIGNYIERVPKESSLEIGNFTVLMSKSAASGYHIKEGALDFNGRAYFKVKDNSKTYSTMEKICKDNGLGADYLINMAKERDNIKSTMMVIKLISYVFIILITIIAVVNIFNTISSNMGMRQMEFATLLSIGMSKKSLDKMIYIECMLIGLKTLLYGLPLTELGLYIIFKQSSLNKLTGYIFPWTSTILSIVIMFITVFAIMTYGTYKVHQKDSATILKNFKD